MKRLVIEVHAFVPPTGREYDATVYPGQGYYYNPTTYQWVLVSRYEGCTTDSVTTLGKGIRPPFKAEELVEPEPATAILHQVNGIQAADLLKAIAISQNPLLAKELLK